MTWCGQTAKLPCLTFVTFVTSVLWWLLRRCALTRCLSSLCLPARLSLALCVSLVAVRAFTAMQVIATIACSFSVLLLSVAFFRPSVGGCSSARRLAFIGGALMAIYAVFQLIAVVLSGTMKQEIESAGWLSTTHCTYP